MAILFSRFQDSLELCREKPAMKAKIDRTGTLTGKSSRAGIKRIDYILVDRGRFNVYDCDLMKREHWPASDHIGYYAIIGSRKDVEKRQADTNSD
jgi:endonuclease/exonuclease/phosphatase family metal-dependent hydrolase